MLFQAFDSKHLIGVNMEHTSYSPVNGDTIEYYGSQHATSQCCGVQEHAPVCMSPQPKPCCDFDDVAPEIKWSDWTIFNDYVGIGFDKFDAEKAPFYIREAGIEFAKRTQCLQRNVLIHIKPKQLHYTLSVPEYERLGGVLGFFDGKQYRLNGSHSMYAGLNAGTVLANSNVFELNPQFSSLKSLNIIVWAKPTEDTPMFDDYLFSEYRSIIVNHARALYAKKFAFRDKELLQFVMSEDSAFTMECRNIASRCKAWLFKKSGERLLSSSLWR